MRYAFVDDATLDAAKRMEGMATAKSLLETAGDILALENLIQAVLFYDQILYLDKNGSRKNHQNSRIFQQFRRVHINEETFKSLLDITNNTADEMIPCIEGGRFTDDCFQSFFRALEMDIRFIWEKRADGFCLTPGIIDKKEVNELLYRRLLYMMLYELSDTSFRKQIHDRIPLLYDSQGQIINRCYVVQDDKGRKYSTKLSRQTEALFKAVNLMSFRSILYTLIAKELKADLILSPIRSVFQWACLNQHCLGKKPVPRLSGVMRRNYLNHMILKKSADCSDLDDGHFSLAFSNRYPAMFLHKIPFFTLWIARHMTGETGFLQTAFALREEKEFIAVRNRLNDIEHLLETCRLDDKEAMEETLSKLDRQMGGIFQKYGLKDRSGSPAFTSIMIGMMSPAHKKLPTPESFRFFIKPDVPSIEPGRRNRFGLVFHPVREELEHMEDLEDYLDVITSRINFRTGAVLQNIRIEWNERSDELQWWRTPM